MALQAGKAGVSWRVDSRTDSPLRCALAEHHKTADDVRRLAQLLRRGDTIHQMMQVNGEEGVSVEDPVSTRT